VYTRQNKNCTCQKYGVKLKKGFMPYDKIG
jgi:hypothetical protein